MGFPNEGWQPLAHNATDILVPGQWGARPCSGGLGEHLSGRGASLHRQESRLRPWRQSSCSGWKMSLPSEGALAFLSPANPATGLSQTDIPAGKKVLMGATALGGQSVGQILAGCRRAWRCSGFHSRPLWRLPGRLCVGRGAVRNRSGAGTPELPLPAA